MPQSNLDSGEMREHPRLNEALGLRYCIVDKDEVSLSERFLKSTTDQYQYRGIKDR